MAKYPVILGIVKLIKINILCKKKLKIIVQMQLCMAHVLVVSNVICVKKHSKSD